MFCLFQAEDGIRYLVRSRGLGDVYKRQDQDLGLLPVTRTDARAGKRIHVPVGLGDVKRPLHARLDDEISQSGICLLYTSDAADERSSVDLGGRRIINTKHQCMCEG